MYDGKSLVSQQWTGGGLSGKMMFKLIFSFVLSVATPQLLAIRHTLHEKRLFKDLFYDLPVNMYQNDFKFMYHANYDNNEKEKYL